jgi:extradiol dioxygenase family protein
VQTDGAGTPREQTKAMIADPSGNAIELKSYADPAAALAD